MEYAPQVTLWPAPPPRRHPRGFWGWVIGATAASLTLCCAVVGGAVAVAYPVVAAKIGDGCAAPARADVPGPRPGDSLSARKDWAKAHIDVALEVQRRALLAGDEDCYLAVVDEHATRAREALRAQFRSLRAMRVAGWSDRGYSPTEGDGGVWEVRLSSTPCFVTAECPESRTASRSDWRIADGRAVLVGWRLDGRERLAPWQADELVGQAGDRVVVATVPAYADELPMLVRVADQAALTADRYARGDAPHRYIVYYAGESEWLRWFGGNLPPWTAGFAIELTQERYEVVIRRESVDAFALLTIMRHELTHAASLVGDGGGRYHDWWLVEGLAEVAAMDGFEPAQHPGLDAVARLVPELKGSIEVRPPDDNTAQEVVGARYTVAYLAVYRLIETYGFDRAMAFYDKVVRDGVEAELAAPPALGAPWAEVERDCVDFVRRTVS